MMLRLSLCLAVIAAIPLSAAKRKYDERGNIVSGAESKTAPAAPAVVPVTPAPEKAEKPAAPEAATASTAPEAAASAESAVKPATADTGEAAREEAEALAQQKNPQTKVYLENAQMYLRSNRADKALEFLKKSQEAGEDEYSREARLTTLWLRARRGDAGLEGEAEGMDDKVKAQALLRIADGYYACAREMTKKPECLVDAERIYAYISELAPRSNEGKLARLRLGLLLVDNGRLEAALPHLTRTLMAEGTDFKTGQALREMPLDRAWYNLGQLYERPWYHRDVHKAQAAYKQVLKYSGSPYQQAARERLASIERFGTGYSRP